MHGLCEDVGCWKADRPPLCGNFERNKTVRGGKEIGDWKCDRSGVDKVRTWTQVEPDNLAVVSYTIGVGGWVNLAIVLAVQCPREKCWTAHIAVTSGLLAGIILYVSDLKTNKTIQEQYDEYVFKRMLFYVIHTLRKVKLEMWEIENWKTKKWCQICTICV